MEGNAAAVVEPACCAHVHGGGRASRLRLPALNSRAPVPRLHHGRGAADQHQGVGPWGGHPLLQQVLGDVPRAAWEHTMGGGVIAKERKAILIFFHGRSVPVTAAVLVALRAWEQAASLAACPRSWGGLARRPTCPSSWGCRCGPRRSAPGSCCATGPRHPAGPAGREGARVGVGAMVVGMRGRLDAAFCRPGSASTPGAYHTRRPAACTDRRLALPSARATCAL